jgi:hypothetical protein
MGKGSDLASKNILNAPCNLRTTTVLQVPRLGIFAIMDFRTALTAAQKMGTDG